MMVFAKKRSLTVKNMKKIVLNLNRGWYVVLSMMCVFVIATVTFVACHNESDPTPADEGIEYPIPENAEVIIDVAGIYKTANGELKVGIGMSARIFYLPEDIKRYQEYYDLLNTKGDLNILKLTIGDKTNKGFPIIKVELPDRQGTEYGRAKEFWSRPSSSETDEVRTKSATLVSIIPSLSAMNTAFNYIKNLGCPLPAPVASNVCIPFRYATDGCYARAHYIRKILDEQYGYDCSKIFSFGNLKATSLATGCCAEWGYHVAVLVSVDNGVSCVDRVFDPSLFNQAVTITEWLNKQKGCTPNTGSVSNYQIQPSYYYGYNLVNNSYTPFDNDYSQTIAFLNFYSNSSGCN
jgi:hypothetical protein